MNARLLRPLLILATATWRESLRRKLLLAGLLLSLGFVALYGLGVYFVFQDADDLGMFRTLAAYQLVSFGIFVSSLLGSMVVIFSASGMINGEAESGLLQPIAARPIRRWQIVMGRYLGYGSLFTVYVILIGGGVLALTRIFGGYADPRPFAAIAYLIAQGLVLLGLVSLLTTLLAPVPTGIAVFMAFGLSFIGGVVRQVGLLLHNRTAEAIGAAVTYILPSDSFFRMSLSQLAPRIANPLIQDIGPFGVPMEPQAWPIVYGVFYIGVCLVLAVISLARKDL